MLLTKVGHDHNCKQEFKKLKKIHSKFDIYLDSECATKSGSECVFPFTYMGIDYESCTSVNHDQLWCPTKDSGPTCMDCWSNDTFTHWENCNDKCKGKIIDKIEDKAEGKSFENALQKLD